MEGLSNIVVFENILFSKYMHDIFRNNEVLSKLIIKSVRVHKHIEAPVWNWVFLKSEIAVHFKWHTGSQMIWTLSNCFGHCTHGQKKITWITFFIEAVFQCSVFPFETLSICKLPFHCEAYYHGYFASCFPKGKIDPILPSLFWCIRDLGRGGAHCVPLNIFGLGGVRVPILFGNYFPRSDLPYSKGFMKLACPEPSKKMFDFWNFCSSQRRLTRFVRVPHYEILVFLMNFIFFGGNEITLRG